MSVRLLTASMAALAVGLIGCGTPPSRTVDHASQATSPVAPPPAPVPVKPVSVIAEGAAIPLATLVDLAERASPTRALFDANRAAAAAAVAQAGAWANPEVELELGRSHAREADDSGSRPTTTTGGVRISQRFELPGKRSSRIAAAEAGRTLAERTAAVDALELALEVRAAALAVALADQQAAQADQSEALAIQVHAAVQARHRVGESDTGDLARANAELAGARLAKDASARDGDAAREALRTWCGAALPARFSVADALPEVPEELSLADAQARARSAHPRLAVLDAQSTAASAAVLREERAWHPDLTVGVAGSRESDANDLGVSFGMEIPLWDRNGGGIAQARADQARIAAERRQELASLERRVLAAWSGYERERRQVAGLSGDLVPAYREALRTRMSAYEAGDAALFDLIDGKRGLMEAERALLEARSRAASARMDLARAVGAAVSLPSPVPAAPPAGGTPASTTIPSTGIAP